MCSPVCISGPGQRSVSYIIETNPRTSLVVYWLRLHAPNAGGPGLIPDQGTRPHMHATTKSQHAANESSHAATKKAPACRN